MIINDKMIELIIFNKGDLHLKKILYLFLLCLLAVTLLFISGCSDQEASDRRDKKEASDSKDKDKPSINNMFNKPDKKSEATEEGDETERTESVQTEPGAASPTPSYESSDSASPLQEEPNEDNIVGVWVYIQANTFGTLAGTMNRHYYVFYSDGTFMRGMPDNGLFEFDFQERIDTASDSDTLPDYGTYTLEDGMGQLSGNNGATLEISMNSQYGSLDIGNYKGFLFIPRLDGMRLEGAYTTIVPNLEGKITEEAIALEPNSFLYLESDGTFYDESGIFRWQGKNYPTMDELFPTWEERESLVYPGSGTYEIADFSLILHYDDGITTKHKILLDAIEMTELDYSTGLISPKEIYIRRERARSNYIYFQ